MIFLVYLKKHILFVLMLLLLVTAWSVRLLDTHFNGYNLVYATHGYYHSDDVAQANILWDWQNGYRSEATVGDDNWVIKYPLYVVTNNLSISPLKKLFINSWVVLVVTAFLMLWAVFRFASMIIKDRRRRIWAVIIVTLALVAIPSDAFGIIKMPNSRNIEIGLFMLLISYLYGFIPKVHDLSNRKKIRVAGLLALSGLLLMDDPLFIYMALPPLAIILLWRLLNKSIDNKTAIFLGMIISVPLIISEILKKIFVLILPVSFVPHTSSFATIDQALSTLRYLGGRGAAMFGVDILGRNPLKVGTIMAVAALTLLIIIVMGVVRENRLARSSIFTSYYALMLAWIPFLLVISSLGGQPGSSRYVILLVFLLPIALIFIINRLGYLRQVYFILGLVVFLALATVLKAGTDLVGTTLRPNTDNYATIKILQDMRLTKGYTRFWDAGIDTYLTDHKIFFMPANCDRERQSLSVGSVLFERAETKKTADKSFYLYVPDDDMKLCSPDTLVPSLGLPIKVIDAPVPGQKIAIYDYDITSVLIKN